jgi:2-dehydropantoate 2-reductase
MAEIAVVGPGSVGTYFAAHLTAAGHDVVACARRPFDRYVVESTSAPVTAPAVVCTDPADLDGPVPWVLLTVKAHQTVGAAAWLEALAGPGTRVIVVQNGVEHVQRVSPFVGDADVLPAVVYCGSELIGPGHIRHYANGLLFVPEGGSADDAAALFAGTGGEVRPTAKWTTEAWRKLATNVVANGITGITLQPMSILRRSEVAVLARRLLVECYAVGRAEGADLPDAGIDRMLEVLGAAREDGGTSMLYDRRAGRATEHDALHGAVLRGAARHGLDVPATEAMYALLSAMSPA